MAEALAGTHKEVEVFSGWKEIATYLGKGVRTVQRYERDFSLPIRRPSGKETGSVIAKKAELDAWIAAAPFREALRSSQMSARKDVIDTRVALKEFKRQVAELHKLRLETAELRTTLHEAVQSLQERLRHLSLEESSLERRARVEGLAPSKRVQ